MHENTSWFERHPIRVFVYTAAVSMAAYVAVRAAFFEEHFIEQMRQSDSGPDFPALEDSRPSLETYAASGTQQYP